MVDPVAGFSRPSFARAARGVAARDGDGVVPVPRRITLNGSHPRAQAAIRLALALAWSCLLAGAAVLPVGCGEDRTGTITLSKKNKDELLTPKVPETPKDSQIQVPQGRPDRSPKVKSIKSKALE
jgi:hypothetical protein